MQTPTTELLREHDTIRKMLDVFENQLSRVSAAEDADYAVLSGSIDYCSDYLDRFHHPKEDRLLEVAAERDRSVLESLEGLSEQHRRLSEMTNQVEKTFDGVVTGAILSRSALARQGRALVDTYRGHLEWEEAFFFPVLESALGADEWALVDGEFAHVVDPLKEHDVEQRFEALAASIAGQPTTQTDTAHR